MHKPLILIDGECVLCNRFARFVIRHDKAAIFQFAALGSAHAQERLEHFSLPPPPAGTFVLIDNGKAYVRSEAACRVLMSLPPPLRYAATLRLVPLPLRDAVYSLIARLRYAVFGRTTSCGLLSPEEKSRFLA